MTGYSHGSADEVNNASRGPSTTKPNPNSTAVTMMTERPIVIRRCALDPAIGRNRSYRLPRLRFDRVAINVAEVMMADALPTSAVEYPRAAIVQNTKPSAPVATLDVITATMLIPTPVLSSRKRFRRRGPRPRFCVVVTGQKRRRPVACCGRSPVAAARALR